jgi:hypothetical protein
MFLKRKAPQLRSDPEGGRTHQSGTDPGFSGSVLLSEQAQSFDLQANGNFYVLKSC